MSTYKGYQYRLRAGSPMPTSSSGEFVIHSFMAEEQVTNIDTCASRVLRSSDFRGQGGSFYSASYSRLAIVEDRYRASEVYNPRFREEID